MQSYYPLAQARTRMLRCDQRPHGNRVRPYEGERHSSTHPRYATLWKPSVTRKDLETRFQKVYRRRAIVAVLASIDRQIGQRHMPRFY